ncbi:hypothetical protein B0H12DRAFT_437117 [Mycena haematopus]|nr:hypothetical protein B0H12DRAFT_437117 [Mycena haematopus]
MAALIRVGLRDMTSDYSPNDSAVLFSALYDSQHDLRTSSWAASSFSHRRPIRTSTWPTDVYTPPPPTCQDISDLASSLSPSSPPKAGSVPLPGLSNLSTQRSSPNPPRSTPSCQTAPRRPTTPRLKGRTHPTRDSAISRRNAANHHPPARFPVCASRRRRRLPPRRAQPRRSPRSTRSTPCPPASILVQPPRPRGGEETRGGSA